MYRRIALAALLVAGHVDSSRAAADPARCRELECGFLRRCHPDEVKRAADERGDDPEEVVRLVNAP